MGPKIAYFRGYSAVAYIDVRVHPYANEPPEGGGYVECKKRQEGKYKHEPTIFVWPSAFRVCNADRVNVGRPFFGVFFWFRPLTPASADNLFETCRRNFRLHRRPIRANLWGCFFFFFFCSFRCFFYSPPPLDTMISIRCNL